MSIQIITDSTAYLPETIINQYGITVLALNVHLPERVCKEGMDISNADYYQYLKNNRVFPLTSQPSTGEFLEAFNRLQAGDEALVILLSSKVSGTLQSAQIACSMLAADHPPITIIDSMSSAMGLGFMVMRAGEMREHGKSRQEIEMELLEMQKAMQVFFIVDDLEYLSRGGRISKLGSFLGNMLKLKPILTLDSGEITLHTKVRTTGKALQHMLEELDKCRNQLHKISVVHVDAQQDAARLQDKLKEDYTVPVYCIELGPVLGTHLGPGMLGIIFY